MFMLMSLALLPTEKEQFRAKNKKNIAYKQKAQVQICSKDFRNGISTQTTKQSYSI